MVGLKKVLFVSVFLLLSAISFAEQPVIVQEFLGQVDFMRGRVTQLADAMPQSAYEWRPMDGVRSVSEVYLHVAFGNYICVTVSGGTVPEEVGFVMDFSKENNWDTQTTNKAMIMEKMNKSFDILKERIAALTEEDINREVEAFGMKMSLRNFIISMIAHCHEHLGQSIAYARMNGVTPPWSKKDSEG
jgi:uncharacterized damage-inducible protein DinB